MFKLVECHNTLNGQSVLCRRLVPIATERTSPPRAEMPSASIALVPAMPSYVVDAIANRLFAGK